MKFASWDLEISQPENLGDDDEVKDGDLWAYGPFHITCAAVHLSDTGHTERWYGWRDGSYADYMDQDEVKNLLMYLHKKMQEGYILTTWNGTAFDWRLLAQETEQHDLCVKLALNSFDPMLQVHAMKGFPVGLGAVAAAFGLGDKLIAGSDAPSLWRGGCYDTVLEYVQQDARLLGEIVREILRAKGVKWVSGTGGVHFLPLTRLYRAGDLRQLPLPDVEWMDEPIPRDQFYAWMEAI